MKIGLITFRHEVTKKSPILPELVSLLAEWGAMVEMIYPEERTTELSTMDAGHDLYVLKSGSELALSYAGALTTRGATIINSYQVSAMMRDKIVATSVLMSAGVPVPETFIGSHPRQFTSALEEPLVVKPYRGSQGRGVRVVWEPEELEAGGSDGGPSFAQRYHAPEGEDRKIYCIGGQLFGVLRKWPAKTYEDKIGKPFTITPELRDISLACGRAFGVDLFGLDVIISEGKPYVVDIQSFPGFKGVPDAGRRLADYIFTVGHRVTTGGEAMMPLEVRA
jgi:ribosomal protein S6--L-glutamate ligase